MEAHVAWTSPAALWHQYRSSVTTAPQRRVFSTPAILRFTSDAYMQEFLDLMQTAPHQMSQRLAVPETWTQRVPDPAPIVPKRGLLGKLERARATVVQKLAARQLALVRPGPWNAAADDPPLKLFHPASQRYYMVTACLICRTLGLPDRPVNTSEQERVSFVIRMVQAPDTVINPDPAAYNELAFVNGSWQPVTGNSFAKGEEQNLMSPLTYVEDDGRRRRMYNGTIPVAKREAYLGAARPAAADAPPPMDPRQISLEQKVIGPWTDLAEVAAAAFAQKDDADHDADLSPANEQIQTISWLILLDLDRWLDENLNPVWLAVHDLGTLTNPTHIDAYNAMAGLQYDQLSLVQALKDIREHTAEIEIASPAYQTDKGWPLFQFATATQTGAGGLAGHETTLENALMAALAGTEVPSTVPVPAIAQINVATQTSPWFTVRCVYERPNCATQPPVVSEPTSAFQLASFFDPDAPARPIRVEMPADTTPAGLRKFDKNTSFVMSDVLCGQVDALRGLTFGDLVLAVLPFPFHKKLSISSGGLGRCVAGGKVCSLSIPIITICALVLLMMIVKILDTVFFWMPFFQICLPTNFKAKG
jgi:hypothetical protein